MLDRADEGLFIRAIHTARFENGAWRIWYAAGRRWQQIAGKDFPTYEIRTSVSPTGTEFPASGDLCLEPAGPRIPYRPPPRAAHRRWLRDAVHQRDA